MQKVPVSVPAPVLDAGGRPPEAHQVTNMFGWILKTKLDIGRVLKMYSKGSRLSIKKACCRTE